MFLTSLRLPLIDVNLISMKISSYQQAPFIVGTKRYRTIRDMGVFAISVDL